MASGALPVVRTDVAAGLDDPVERRPIDDQVLDDRERLGSPRLERERIAILEKPHVKLADGRAAPRAMGHAVDQEPARPADALAAIVVEGDRLFAAADQLFVQDVEHLQKRHVGRHPLDLVGDELARPCSRLSAARS